MVLTFVRLLCTDVSDYEEFSALLHETGILSAEGVALQIQEKTRPCVRAEKSWAVSEEQFPPNTPVG
jgi:hypothetical protein